MPVLQQGSITYPTVVQERAMDSWLTLISSSQRAHKARVHRRFYEYYYCCVFYPAAHIRTLLPKSNWSLMFVLPSSYKREVLHRSHTCLLYICLLHGCIPTVQSTAWQGYSSLSCRRTATGDVCTHREVPVHGVRMVLSQMTGLLHNYKGRSPHHIAKSHWMAWLQYVALLSHCTEIL